jgi:alpha-amylase
MGKRLLALFILPFLLFYSFPVQAVEKEERTWQDEMIYFIMVDRFHNGDPKNDFDVDVKDPKAYHGGDFKGIIEKLDYVKDMGFTAICLTPVFKNEPNGYHGYWIEDFYKVEEHFGTMEDFKQLVKEAHKRDLKVILDFVANHTGYHHPWLNDPTKKDWFHERKDIQNWNNQEEVENGQLYGLPDIAQENPETKKYLLDAAKWWIQETDIDGYRLDKVEHVPKWFWEEFAKEVRSVKKDFFLLGEVRHEDPRYVADYTKVGIDAFIDYSFYNEAIRIFNTPDQPLSPLYTVWKQNQTLNENQYLLGTFLDNHDTVRFTRISLENRQYPITRLKLALAYLYSAPGIPIVYYGTEIAMDGGKDPDNRRLMNFRTENEEIVNYISKLGKIRSKYPSLTRGDFELLHEKDGMAVFKRTYQNETTVIAINNSSKQQTVVLTPDQLPANKELRGLLNGDLVRSTEEGYPIVLKPEMSEIYICAEKTGLNYPFIATLIAIPSLFVLFIYLNKRRQHKS